MSPLAGAFVGVCYCQGVLDLWLIRHAESLGNLNGTHADTQLSARGRLQAEALAAALAGQRFDQVVSSPLQRARETAAIALPERAILVEDRLRELPAHPERFIDVSGLAPSQLLALLQAGPAEPLETGSAFMARVREWVEELPRAGRVVAITHFGVVRECLAVLFPGAPRVQTIGCAAISRVSVTPGASRVVALDDRRHLTAFAPAR